MRLLHRPALCLQGPCVVRTRLGGWLLPTEPAGPWARRARASRVRCSDTQVCARRFSGRGETSRSPPSSCYPAKNMLVRNIILGTIECDLMTGRMLFVLKVRKEGQNIKYVGVLRGRYIVSHQTGKPFRNRPYTATTTQPQPRDPTDSLKIVPRAP